MLSISFLIKTVINAVCKRVHVTMTNTMIQHISIFYAPILESIRDDREVAEVKEEGRVPKYRRMKKKEKIRIYMR